MKLKRKQIKTLVDAIKIAFPKFLDGYNYVAVDKYGGIFVYDYKPEVDPINPQWTDTKEHQLIVTKIFEYDNIVDNWEKLCFKI